MSHRTRVLVYNVKFLPPLGRMLEPPLLDTRGFWEIGQVTRSDEARAMLLAAHLSTRTPAFDVVVLAEVFASHARRAFGEAFARAGYHVATCPPGPSKLFATSGLFVASRLPIARRAFSAYSAASGSDRFARKGILHVRLEGPERSLDLFATHLQAGRRAFIERRFQLAHARAFVERHATPGDPTLLGGDFNVIGERADGTPTDEYQSLATLFSDFMDVHRRLADASPAPTWDPRDNAQMVGSRHVELERLDYLFARGDDVIASLDDGASVEVLRFEHEGLPLSDHYALAFELPRIV